jgi:L-threonylcarbamoyladenylate synthase
MARLRSLKPRAAGRGTIVLIATPADLDAWAASPDPVARSIADAHWPGALTIVVPASARAPEAVLGPEGTIALRCPGLDLLRAIVSRAGGLVASTSANAPDEPPAVTADHPLASGVDLVLDAGRLAGIPSTVIAVREGAVRVLREGAVRLGADA